jgi:hypothetical protein
MRSALLSGFGVALVALAGCGGSSTTTKRPATSQTASKTQATGPTLNSVRVAHAIERSIRTQRHVRASVRCPSHVPQRKGWHFVCFATSAAGQTPFIVTEVNRSGQVTYVAK